MIILDDQAHQQMTLHFQLSLQCNVLPIMGFVRHTAKYRICPYRSRGQEDKSLIEAGPE